MGIKKFKTLAGAFLEKYNSEAENWEPTAGELEGDASIVDK